MKKETGKSKEFSKDREFAVILEGISKDIKIIIEDLTSVKNRVELMFEELGKQKEDIFIIKADIRIIKGDIATLKNDVAEIKESVKDHTKRLTHLEAIK